MELLILGSFGLVLWYMIKLSGQLHRVKDALESIEHTVSDFGIENPLRSIDKTLGSLDQTLDGIKDELKDFKAAWEAKNE